MDACPPLTDEHSVAYIYNPTTRHVAIETWVDEVQQAPSSAVIVLGGLTDGPLALPYVKQLILNLGKDCCVVQPILSSSYLGYGTSSIDQDCRELDSLVGYLLEHRRKQKVVLLGHSTGAQITLRYLSGTCSSPLQHALNEAVAGGILQGPVSDREYAASSMGADLARFRDLASQMVSDGKGQELLPREVDPAPITADRFLSLTGQQTPDDLFSSDLPTEYLRDIYSRVKVPMLVLLSGAEEYIPSSFTADFLKSRVFEHVPGQVVVLEGANHAVSNSQSARDQLCAEVLQFLRHMPGFLETAQDQA